MTTTIHTQPKMAAGRPSQRSRRSRAADSDPSITAEEVQVALQRMLASKDFPATERNRRFLAYAVGKTLEGKAGEITGYKVATEVFGRPESFNPTTDPIVRIEAGKIRRDLEVYYLKSGGAEEIRIHLPRGAYEPVFQRHREGVPGSVGAALDLQGITVHTLHIGGGAAVGAESALRTRVVDRLARQTDLAVFAGPVLHGQGGLLDSDAARELGRRNGTRFILSGDVHGHNGGMFFTARLHDGATGRLMWSEDLMGDGGTMEEMIARRVADARRVLAQKLEAGVVSPSAL